MFSNETALKRPQEERKIGPEPRFRAIFGLLLASALWGASYALVKQRLGTIDGSALLAGRTAVAALCLAPFILLGTRPKVRGDRLKLALMTLCEPCLYFGLETAALHNVDAFRASVVAALLPLAAALGARLFFGVRIGGRLGFCLGLGLAGAVGLAALGRVDAASPAPGLGLLLEAGAVVAAAGYMLLYQRLSRPYPALFLTALQAMGGLVFFSLWAFAAGTRFPLRDPDFWVASLGLGVGVTVLAAWLYNRALRALPPALTGLCLYSIPVFALFAESAWTGALPSRPEIVSAGALFVAVWAGQSAKGVRPGEGRESRA